MIDIHPVETLIRDHPLFAGAGLEIAALLASCARTVAFRDGDLILKEGEPAREFILIRSGRVSLETRVPGRGSVVLQTLESGDAIGLSWLVPPHLLEFDARAIGTVHAVSFDATCLQAKCESDPRIGYAFMRLLIPTLVERLRTARVQVLDLYAGAVAPGPA